MRTATKAAIIGGAGLAAYLLVIRPQLKKGETNGNSLIPSEEIREKFNRLPLKAHEFLRGIPLHSLDYVELEGGREKMTIAEIYDAAGLDEIGEIEVGAVTKALFDLRGAIGKVMRWDDVPALVEEISYLLRLTEEEREKSLVPPGETRGIARVLYAFENEMVLEIINKTVHCFWVMASEKTADGYNLYNAVYVKKLNWRTPIYMTLISPVLKSVVYPAIGKSIRQNWEREFSNDETSAKAAS
jgi:hypothetical protein